MLMMQGKYVRNARKKIIPSNSVLAARLKEIFMIVNYLKYQNHKITQKINTKRM